MWLAKMHELTETEVNALRWSDANYFGYYWDSQFVDPTLVLRIEAANSPIRELVCNWATCLKLSLEYKNHVNALLTWKVSFESLPEERWKVFLGFTSHGSIEFECNGLALREVTSVTAT